MSQQSRAQYSPETKARVHVCYPICKSPEDRKRLAEDEDIGSLQKLYNMASRIDATRAHAGSSEDWMADDGYDATQDWARLYLRDDPETVTWSKDDDRFLRDHFGRTKIEEIGVFLNRSETAVAYRVRELGLRNIPKYYDIRKVAPWLGLKVSDVMLMTKIGLEVFPCCNAEGEIKITLVSTTSLARTLLRGRLWKRLVDKYDADEFFIRDIIESIVALQKGEAVWEPSPWVSHGRVSLNPYSETCFGLFYDGYDEKMAGDDLDPRDLHPRAKVTSDNWRRGENGTDDSDEQLKTLGKELLQGAPQPLKGRRSSSKGKQATRKAASKKSTRKQRAAAV